MEKKIFLSHSSADRAFVEGLAKKLGAQGIPVWYSDWEIHVGDSIVEKVDSAIGEMAGLIVVLSKASVDSPWVREELNAGLMRHLAEKSVKIFPVRIDSCQIPTLLAHRRYADFSRDSVGALNALVESILPASALVSRIGELRSIYIGLLDQMKEPPEGAPLDYLFAEITALLEEAVRLRYVVEARANGWDKDDMQGFLKQFRRLVDHGYDIQSPEWEWILAIRNASLHGFVGNLGTLQFLRERRALGYKGTEESVDSVLQRIDEIFDRLLKAPGKLNDAKANA